MRLVAKPISKARTRKRLAPSRISAPFVLIGCFLMPFYLRFVLSFRKIEIRTPEKITEAIRDFQEKRTRLIVAFRHPYGDEPQLLFHVFENLLPRYAKKAKTPLLKRPQLRLVHDYAVPLWGGAFIRFILPRAGALPVYHVKYEPASIKNIRNILRDGTSPLEIAPEGQVSYHSETLPRIEQGTIRIGFWCAAELAKAARPEKVCVLPISVHYQYDLRDQKKIKAALTRVESLCGLNPASENNKDELPDLLTRIEAIDNRVLCIAEEYYATLGYQPHNAPEQENEPADRQRRWEALQPFALKTAEHLLGLAPRNDDLVQRMYRVRLECWDRICPEYQIDQLPRLEAALAHRRAGEAWFAMRHMELVDLMSYHDINYLNAQNISFDRIVEITINLEDLVNRLMGGNINNRPNVIRKKAVIVPDSCLNLTERLPDYRKSPKETACEITDELARKFETCIKRYHHETE